MTTTRPGRAPRAAPNIAALRRQARPPALEAPVEARLIRSAQAGDTEARDRLIRHHMRLVIHLAATRRGVRHLDLDDLIQEGTLGLVAAIERHDPTTGPLAAYASTFITSHMYAAMAATDLAIRCPRPVYKARRRLAWARTRLPHGATDEQLAHLARISPHQVQALTVAPQVTVSLDAAPAGTRPAVAQAFLTDPAPGPHEALERTMDFHTARALTARLPEPARTIIRARFNLDHAPRAASLADLAARLGMTRIEVVRHEHHAMGLMRAMTTKERTPAT